MLKLGIVDQGHGGLRHGGQFGNFAGVVHAKLDHTRLVRGSQAQQRQRHADIVVEIAFGGKCLLAPELLQDGRDHLRDGGLAVATGDCYQRQLELRAPAGSQLAQRRFAVSHLQARQARFGQALLCQGGNGALGAGLPEKIMGIKSLTLERNKQVTGAQAARVRVNARKSHAGIAHQLRTRQHGLSLGQCHHAPAPETCAV